MIPEQHYILPGENGFKGVLLDEYLAVGYYRMQHMVFTTQYTQVEADSDVFPVFWLRTKVRKINENKAVLAIRRKCAAFKVEFKKATITTEAEDLYCIYRKQLNFKASENCREYLHELDSNNPFNSWIIEVRDDTTLIAVGIFDKGQHAISGILNFYHPAYSKYSLGKYLMLLKIDYARLHHIPLYYTGYISTAMSKFDYKLFPDKEAIEVFLPVEKSWVAYEKLGKDGLEDYFLYHFINTD